MTTALACAEEMPLDEELTEQDAEQHDGLQWAAELSALDGPEHAHTEDAAGSVRAIAQHLDPPPCPAITLPVWPLHGSNGLQWSIFNYTDRDSSAGTSDYTGATGDLARTYNGHNGLDIAIANFRRMDDQSALVLAAAGGTVVRVEQGAEDRETSLPDGCNRSVNFVEIDQGNGYRALYLHLKRNSVRVAVGQTVAAGALLGVVGSSGCSSQAHLHFELRCNGNVVETLSPNLWATMPEYRATSNVLDTVIRAGSAPTTAELLDPKQDATVVPPGVLGVGVTLAAVAGDVLHIRVRRPNGTTSTNFDWTVDGTAKYIQRVASFSFNVQGAPGNWTVEAQVNNGSTLTKTFRNTTSDFDVDGDGRADFLCHNVNTGIKTLQYGLYRWATPPFTQKTSSAFCNHAGAINYTGDFNGDGRMDLLCHEPATGRKWAMFADHRGLLGTADDWYNPGTFCSHRDGLLLIGDFNGDRRDDWLCHDRVTGEKWIAFASGNGVFAGLASNWKNRFCARPYERLHVADFNADGREDLLCHHQKTGEVWIDYADANGGLNATGFDWYSSYNYCSHATASLHVGDFNADGRNDLLCHDSANGNKWIRFANAAGNFPATSTFTSTTYCSHVGGQISVRDYDGDGRDDILCNDYRNGDNWLDFTNSSGGIGNIDWYQSGRFCTSPGDVFVIN